MNRRFIIPLLIGATLLTYGRAVNLGFTSWDDADTIASNPRLNPPGFDNLLHYWSHAEGGLYIPVTYTWWSALAVIGRAPAPDGGFVLRPWVFHGGNVVLHVIAVLLVFGIVSMLIEDNVAATLAALIFALHPVQAESVAWASGAKDLLAGVFAFGSIDQFLRFSRKRSHGGGWREAHYAAAITLFALAILSKPSAVVTPLIGGVLVWFRLRPPIPTILVRLFPMLVLAGACAVWSRIAQPQYAPTDTPLWTRPFIAADAIAFYLWKLVWPVDLAIVYGRTPTAVLNSGQAYFTWILPALAGICVWMLRRRAPWLFAGAIVFVVGLLPVLGFARFMFQIHSTVADHYLYIPMLGVAVAVGGALAHPRRGVIATACAVLVLLGLLSNRQLRHWQDSESLYARALQVNPRAHTVRGLLAQHFVSADRIDEAIGEFRTLVSLSPRSRLAHANLAYAYVLAGRTGEAIEHGTIALSLALPGDNTGWEHYVLGRAYMLAKRYDDAVTHFTERLRQHPHEAAVHDLEAARRARDESAATRPATVNDR